MTSSTTIVITTERAPPLQLVLRRPPDVPANPALADIQYHANLVLAHQARVRAYAELEQTDLEKSAVLALAVAGKVREETGTLQLEGAEEHRKRLEDDLAQLRRIMAAAEKFLEGRLADCSQQVQASTDHLTQLTAMKEKQEQKIQKLKKDLCNIK